MPSAKRRFSFDLASAWAVALTLGLAAILFIPSASVPLIYAKVSLLALGALVALACFILARLTRGSIIVPPLALVGAFWLVPLAYVLSALFSGAGFSSAFFGTELEVDTAGFMVLVAGLATIAALALRRSSQYLTFLRVAFAAFGLTLLAQIVFVILGKMMPASVSSATSLIASFGDLGWLTGLGVILVLLTMRFWTVGRRMRIALYVAGVVGLLVLALVNSALAWVMVALVALGLFIEAIMRRRPVAADDMDLDGADLVTEEEPSHASGPHSMAEPLVVLAVALFFIIGGSTVGAGFQSALGANVLDVRPSWQSTFSVGRSVYAHSAIFGSGPGTFMQDWVQYRDASLNGTVFWSVDFPSGIGLIPTSVVTTGILGALAWIAFLVLLLWIGIRGLLMRAPQDAFIRYVSTSSFIAALYVFAVALFATPGPVVLAAGFIFAGIFASTLRYAGEGHEWGIAFSKSPRLGFAIVFVLTLVLLGSVFGAYGVVVRYLADASYLSGANALAAGNIDAAQAAAARSLVYAPSAQAYRLAAAAGIARMQQIANDSTLSADQAQSQFQSALSSSVSAALAATNVAPGDYQNWAALGTVYGTVIPLKIQGAYDNAKAAYQKAIGLNPTSPALPYALAQLDIANGDNAAAETDLTNAIKLKSDYTAAIFLYSQLMAQEGKAPEALQAAQAAAYFAPNDPTVLFQVGILSSATGNQQAAIAALARAVQLNPQYANARFYLAVAYADTKDNANALAQLQAIAALSDDNAKAVQPYIDQLQAGKNPFPVSKLGALGAGQPPVTDNASAQGKPVGTASTTPAQ